MYLPWPRFKELLDCADTDLVDYVKSILMCNKPSEPNAEEVLKTIFLKKQNKFKINIYLFIKINKLCK